MTPARWSFWAPVRAGCNGEPLVEELAPSYEAALDCIERTRLTEPEFHNQHPVLDIGLFVLSRAW